MKIKNALTKLNEEKRVLEKELTEIIKEHVNQFRNDHEVPIKGIQVIMTEADCSGTGPAIIKRYLGVKVDLGIALACDKLVE